jgi:hypothetical protein
VDTTTVAHPAQDVADALWHLRKKAAIVPMDWIVDETRDLDDWQYANSVYRYAWATLPSARIDLWKGKQPPRIICESRSLAGVLRRIANDYLCPIAATNGQVGGFLHTTLGPLIKTTGGKRRVLYFEDLDLSGGHIEENTRNELSEYGELDWKRPAITDVQVRNENLTVATKKDNRYKPPREFPAVETEALKQQKIQRILLDALNDAVPEPLDDVREREEDQRVQVGEALLGVEDATKDKSPIPDFVVDSLRQDFELEIWKRTMKMPNIDAKTARYIERELRRQLVRRWLRDD